MQVSCGKQFMAVKTWVRLALFDRLYMSYNKLSSELTAPNVTECKMKMLASNGIFKLKLKEEDTREL